MPIKHAAFKALRKMKKRAARNAEVKSEVDFLLRQSRKLISGQKLKEATESVKKTVVALDRASQNKILKKNTASRLKSRLMHGLHLATVKPAKK